MRFPLPDSVATRSLRFNEKISLIRGIEDQDVSVRNKAVSSQVENRPGPVKILSPLAQPILAGKILDAGEFLFVIGNDGVTKCNRLGRNEQVIRADWLTRLLKPGTQQSVGSICRWFEGQNFKRSEHRLKLGREPW